MCGGINPSAQIIWPRVRYSAQYSALIISSRCCNKKLTLQKADGWFLWHTERNGDLDDFLKLQSQIAQTQVCVGNRKGYFLLILDNFAKKNTPRLQPTSEIFETIKGTFSQNSLNWCSYLWLFHLHKFLRRYFFLVCAILKLICDRKYRRHPDNKRETPCFNFYFESYNLTYY